jgi:rhodanese-related sulfurtransferase
MKTPHDLVMAAKALIREVSLDEAEQAIRDADVLLDVREADEFAAGHPPGAVHVSRGCSSSSFRGTPELSNRDLKIVLYCKTGGRAALAARSLQEMGYLHVQSLAGGFDTWAAAGRPVAKPSLPAFD